MFLVFAGTAVGITLLHLLFHPIRVLGMDTSIFYMDEKYTLAAFFSVVTAFLIGFLSLSRVAPAQPKGNKRLLETAYGLFFLILSLDEYFEVHEYITTLVKSYFHNGELIGLLANASWIFPLSLCIGVIFILLTMKILQAAHNVRIPMILGACSFMIVLALELLGSIAYGQSVYVIFVAMEEGMEMIGISFFLLATLQEVT